MAFVTPLSQNTTLTLSDPGDGVVVGHFVTIAVSNNAAIVGASTGQQAVIYGEVLSGHDSTINLGLDSIVTIKAGGFVGNFGNGRAILSAAGSSVFNAGVIEAPTGSGIVLVGNPDSTSTVVNSGQINVAMDGILSTGGGRGRGGLSPTIPG